MKNLPNDIEFYLIDLRSAEAVEENSLFEEERERLKNIANDSRASQFSMGRGFIRSKLAARLKCDTSELKFIENEHGRPALENYPDTHFNLSHSYPFSAAVIANYSVAVDLEKLESKRVSRKILERVLAPDSLRRFDKIKDEDAKCRYFYKAWTAYEAYVKARGLSIFSEGKSFEYESTESDSISCGAYEIITSEFTETNLIVSICFLRQG